MSSPLVKILLKRQKKISPCEHDFTINNKTQTNVFELLKVTKLGSRELTS